MLLFSISGAQPNMQTIDGPSIPNGVSVDSATLPPGNESTTNAFKHL